jgi:hypothetical protein
MEYTPKQIDAYAFIAARRREAEMREELHVNTLATRGDTNAIRRQMREWEE